MIGQIAGDIIASPYVKVPTGGYSDIFFPLFEPVTTVKVDEERKKASSRTYEHEMTAASRIVLAAARWYMSLLDNPESKMEDYLPELADRKAPFRGLDILAVCGPIVELSNNEGEARSFAARAISQMVGGDRRTGFSDTLVSMLWRVKSGDMDFNADVTTLQEAFGLPVIGTASEIRPFLEGTVTFGEKPGTLVPGDGKRSTDPALYASAALIALKESDSFEECVRRAVAMGGDAAFTASLAGAMGELRYKVVPENISYRVNDFLDDVQQSVINSARRYQQAPEDRKSHDVDVINGRTIGSVRMEGMVPVYGVDPDDREALDAIEASHAELGFNTPYRIVAPEEVGDVLRDYDRQADAKGNDLVGVFVENPRPELRTLWIQGGRLVSSTTRAGVRVAQNVEKPLPSVDVRRRVFSEFQEFKRKVNDIRRAMEERVQFNADEYGGRHLSFPSARYPEVRDNCVLIYENGIVRGACGINADGLFGVDTNAAEYTFHGEGIDGVLNTQEFFKKGMNMNQCLAALNYFCLDIGVVPDEEEAKHLADDDDEAVAIRKKYGSNFEKVIKDMGVFDTRMEFDSAIGAFDKEHGTSLRAKVTDDESLNAAVLEAKTALLEGFHRLDGSRKRVPLTVADTKDVFERVRKCEANVAIHTDGSQERRPELVKDVVDGLYYKGKKVGYDEVLSLYEHFGAYQKLSDLHLLPEAVMPKEWTVSEEEKALREERRAESERRYAQKGVFDVVTLRDSELHQGAVFTIGFGKMPVDDFIANLKRHGIKVVCDARSYPDSKFAKEYNSGPLEKALEAAGIEYEGFPLLGEKQAKRKGKDAPIYSFEELLGRESFRKEIDCLRENAPDVRMAVMSREASALNSHRALLIGRALAHPELIHPKEVKAEAGRMAELQSVLDKARADLRQVEQAIPSLKGEELEKASRQRDRKAKAVAKAEKELDAFGIACKYVPVEVQHINYSGGLMSQEKVEEKLLRAFIPEGGEDASKEELLSKAYSGAEKALKDKESPSKILYQRLMETSRMKQRAKTKKFEKGL